MSFCRHGIVTCCGTCSCSSPPRKIITVLKQLAEDLVGSHVLTYDSGKIAYVLTYDSGRIACGDELRTVYLQSSKEKCTCIRFVNIPVGGGRHDCDVTSSGSLKGPTALLGLHIGTMDELSGCVGTIDWLKESKVPYMETSLDGSSDGVGVH
jgi:hypothetical protein